MRLKRPKLKKTEVVLLFVTLCVGVFALYISFGQSIMARYTALQLLLNETQAKLVKEVKYISANKNKAACMRQFLKRHSITSQQKNISNIVIKDIGRFAENSGLTIKEVKPLYVDRRANFMKVAVQLQLSGKISRLLKFIEKVERNRGLFVIEKALLRKNKHEVNLQLTLYRIYFVGNL